MESSSDEEEVFLPFVIFRRKLKKKRIRQWIRSIFQNRETKGHYHALIQEMRMNNQQSFFKYVFLLYYKKKNTFRRPIFLLLPPESIKKYCFLMFSEGMKKIIGPK